MNKKIYINLIIFFCIISCNNNANVPKPKGFVKYTFPEKNMKQLNLIVLLVLKYLNILN